MTTAKTKRGKKKRVWDRVKREYPQVSVWLKEDTTDERGQDLATLVAVYRAAHGQGPAWRALAKQARPELQGGEFPQWVIGWYADGLIRRLSQRGWLAYGEEEGSLKPGPLVD